MKTFINCHSDIEMSIRTRIEKQKMTVSGHVHKQITPKSHFKFDEDLHLG